MKKLLKVKSLLWVSVFLIFVFGALGAVTASAENNISSPQDSTAVLTVEDESETEQISSDETEVLETYEDNSLDKMSSAETVLIVLLSVLIVVELIGTAVLIVLILKKSKNT